ncbi:MAG: beta-lactamase family protein [Gammaproteobacteria bacterium]|nr:beta-lactamase family protein [Gammaproteobacteria bacterium]
MKKTILLISIFSLLLVSCEHGPSSQYTYRPPENMNDGFNVGSLDEVNIDPALIVEAVNSLYQGRYKEVHSMLIFRDNKLVFEAYFKGHRYKYDGNNHHGELVTWDRSMLHSVMSVTKSITSACIGIAIDNGFIESVHQSIFDYLPEHQHLNTDGKDRITIEHLLTMTSGLQWNEWAMPYSNLKNDMIVLSLVEDPIAYYLNKQLTDEPGESFNYAGGANIVLGEIIKNATKMNIDEFSGKYLFEPLGIAPYYWTQYKNGVVEASGSLKITPRDMAKIGVTFLNMGVWKGQRIISEQWVYKSAASFPGNNWMNDWDDHFGMRGYSYSWWTHHFVKSSKRIDMFYAGGWGGQFIMVIPELNTVVVFTGGNYLSYRPSFEILKKYILPAFNKVMKKSIKNFYF